MLIANINSVVATELLEKLVYSGMLVLKRLENSITYYPTQEGIQFVRRYSDLVSMLLPGMLPVTRLSGPSRGIHAWI